MKMRLSLICQPRRGFRASGAGQHIATAPATEQRRRAAGGLFHAMNKPGRLLILAVCGLTALSFGCRGADRPATAPVSGTVTLDGKPLPYGQVVFHPLGGRVAKGTVEDGRFTLGTFEAADGAVLGRHRVSVTARKIVEGEEPGAPGVPQFGPSLIPDRYGNVAASGLEFEVKPGDNVFHIELFSR